MHTIEDITIAHDNVTGSIMLIVPKPLLFETVEEFELLLETLQSQIDDFKMIGCEETNIESNYAIGVLEDWNKEIQEKFETPGPKK